MNRFSTSLLGEAKTLLLATDGSIFSDGALQEAIFFGQACGARLIVLHVVKIDVESLKSANSKVTRAQQEIAPYMEDVRKMARDSGVECETVVVGSSVPEHAIVEQARMREADVILMGRHGRAGRLFLMVGSMTSKVIGLGFPMVLMLPKDFTMTGAHVLVAVDDSANSRLAVEEALSLGLCCVTLERLIFVAVARRESGLVEARKMVEDICARGREKWPHVQFEAVAGVGHASNIIVRAAEERHVDMIMIGGMVSGPLPRMFGGRVTKEVCGWAHCAVLVVTA
ncbi:MAG: universal stress protein [Deltaproteobacteria bacterium HGW-Deltaproteobacteria-18]|jgi:nucleotide-binding universal stress UspA family protein|nr:MAG: universal stress protein [Deltaproteobacteria bacterium HGW-Deltaproteobacteria-18]